MPTAARSGSLPWWKSEDDMKKKMISAIEWLFGLVGVVMILVETYAVLVRNVLLVSTP